MFQDTFEALSKILRNVEILVSSKPHLTFKDILPKAKDSVERSSRPGVVYHIPCRDCTGIYLCWGNWTGLLNKIG